MLRVVVMLSRVSVHVSGAESAPFTGSVRHLLHETVAQVKQIQFSFLSWQRLHGTCTERVRPRVHRQECGPSRASSAALSSAIAAGRWGQSVFGVTANMAGRVFAHLHHARL